MNSTLKQLLYNFYSIPFEDLEDIYSYKLVGLDATVKETVEQVKKDHVLLNKLILNKLPSNGFNLLHKLSEHEYHIVNFERGRPNVEKKLSNLDEALFYFIDSVFEIIYYKASDTKMPHQGHDYWLNIKSKQRPRY